jgi:mRNA interferase HigB
MGACYNTTMHIISKKKLVEFWEDHPDAADPLKTWYHHAERSLWLTPVDIQKDYGNDVIKPDNRAVFDIKGNHYRLVVRVNYKTHRIYIRFIGKHSDYEDIDILKI